MRERALAKSYHGVAIDDDLHRPLPALLRQIHKQPAHPVADIQPDEITRLILEAAGQPT
jgi:hypothetical protein